MYNSGQLASIIIKQNEKDIAELGEDYSSQLDYIFKFLNIARWKLAKLADRADYSDQVEITGDGYVTFTKSGSAITNMFEPRTIYMPNGQPMTKRTSEEAPVGWWRESAAQEIHVKGFSLTTNQKLVSGLYTLKYVRYPKIITLADDDLDFPPSGYDALIKEVSAMIKLPKNSYGGSEYFVEKAKQQYNNIGQGSISAKGTGSTGQPLGFNDVDKAKG